MPRKCGSRLLCLFLVASALLATAAGDGGGGTCPASCKCSGHTCMNSNGPNGTTGAMPPDPVTNQCNNCEEGFEGVSCEQCTSQLGCPSNQRCRHTASFHKGGTASHECTLLYEAMLGLLNATKDGEGVTVLMQWDKPSGWTDGGRDGTMRFNLYRNQLIPGAEERYLNPFFECEARKCAMTAKRLKKGTGPVASAVQSFSGGPASDGDTSGVEVKSAQSMPLNARGWVLAGCLVVTASLLAGAGLIRSSRTRRMFVKYGSWVLGFELLLLLLSNAFSMRKEKGDIDLEGSYVEVTYECESLSKEGGCRCSPQTEEDKQFSPRCNAQVEKQLNALPGPTIIRCDNSTNSDWYNETGLYACVYEFGGLPVFIACQAAQCVEDETDVHVYVPPENKTSAVLEACIVLFCVGLAAVAVHFAWSIHTSKERMKEWRRLHSSPPNADTEFTTLSPTETETDRGNPVDSSALRLGCKFLTYRIGVGEDAKTILNRITLEIPPGQSLAIMGPSGAGKTTLLDLLAAREKSGVVSGSVVLNGVPVSQGPLRNMYRDMIGYVAQEDTLIPSLTVLECVMYSARLRLPAGMPDNVKRQKAEEVIAALGLLHCKNSKVGGSRERGISGGEKRRVSIAMELVANPRVLFLDEPTSGLDSYNALVVMRTIAELKTRSTSSDYASFFNYQPAIVFSIHQPSREIFDTFDNLMLLSKGHLLYCGSAASTLETCARLGYRAPEGVNPPDFLLKIASTLSSEERTVLASAAVARLTQLSAHVRATSHGLTNASFEFSDTSSINSQELLMTDGLLHSPTADLTPTGGDAVPVPAPLQRALETRKYYINFYQELWIVGQRGYNSLVGSYYLVTCHIVVTLLLGAGLLTFYNRQPLTLEGALNRAGCITFTMLLLGFSSLSALELFLTERQVYVRERTNRYYGSLSYFLTKIVFDIIPLRIVPPLFLGCVTYNQMGLRTDDPNHFLVFLHVLVLFNIITAGISFTAAMFTPSFGSGVLIASLVMLTFFAFNPLIVQGDSLPDWISWVRFMSPFFLTFEALMVNELKGQRCTFSPSSPTGERSSTSIPINCEQYLTNLGMTVERFGFDVAMLQLWAVIYLVVAWVGLWAFVRDRR